VRPDIVPGVTFPDYELSDHAAKRRKLSDLQGPHPMVLVPSRGGFCPKDRRQAEGLVQLHRELDQVDSIYSFDPGTEAKTVASEKMTRTGQ
jgi:peroxiredoxin